MQIRQEAAGTEDAWKLAGKAPGLQIWRIEKFKVVAWPKDQYGKFYEGDSYIVLNTYKKPDVEKLFYDVHFWIGKDSTQDEYGTAAYKTVELDDFLGGDPVQHREIQGSESRLFLSYFKSVQFLSGGVETGFRAVKPTEYRPRLLHIKGARQIVIREVEMSTKSLNKGDVFILDAGLDIYQLTTSKSGGMERVKAAEFARSLDDERGGKPTVHVFSEDDNDKAAVAFWTHLGGRGAIAEPTPDVPQKSELRLFRVSDASGKLQMTEVTPAKRASMDSNDAFIVDAGHEVFVWIGKNASKDERKHGLGYATDYLFKNNRPKSLPISRVIEGGENESFESVWK